MKPASIILFTVGILFADNAPSAFANDYQIQLQPISQTRSEDVKYKNGSIDLAALLLFPESSKPVPGAVIIQGSGSSDRTNQWARAIADVLVKSGVAVLLTDKRGSGASGGNWQTSNFSDLSDDALAGVEYLSTRKEIDTTRIGVVGLSQGGWVAPLSAARSSRVAFVVNISGASVTYAEQSLTEMTNSASQAGLTDAQVAEVIELNRAAGEYVLNGDWSKYARLREKAVRSDWRRIAEGFPGGPDLKIWTFLRGVATYDPVPYWIQVNAPVLVIYGELDEKDNVPVAESVRRLRHAFGLVRKKNYKIEVIPGAGHSFIDPQRRELIPQFVDLLAKWVQVTVLDK